MFKVSALFHLTLVFVLLVAGVLLWAVGSSAGAIHSIEKFMRSIGFEGFRFVGSQLLRGFAAFGVVLVVVGTGLSVLVAVVYNLISDVVGGIQYVVLEETPRPGGPAGRDDGDTSASPSVEARPPQTVLTAAGGAVTGADAEPVPSPAAASTPTIASEPEAVPALLPPDALLAAPDHQTPVRPEADHEAALAAAAPPSRSLPWPSPEPRHAAGDGSAPLNGARTLSPPGSFEAEGEKPDGVVGEPETSET